MSKLGWNAFSIAASGIYLVNDANDVAADRAHPTKRKRPIAAGIVAPGLAMGVAAVLLVGALALSSLASVQLVIVLAVYIVVQLAYCYWLKHQAVLDICVVASGARRMVQSPMPARRSARAIVQLTRSKINHLN